MYAAAAVALLAPAAGAGARARHERVLALARDYANPSADDAFFARLRHKDPFLGLSWASGLAPPGGANANGQNQESSSEAVHAYAALYLYADAMAQLFDRDGDAAARDAMRRARASARALASSEAAAARRYWHIARGGGGGGAASPYPLAFAPAAVGIVWSNGLAQFQTWFSAAPWAAYGIQLLPITPVSEAVLDGAWARALAAPMRESCERDAACAADGWSTLVAAVDAVAGDWRAAFDEIRALPDGAFANDAAGGNGQSRSNALMWAATRPLSR